MNGARMLRAAVVAGALAMAPFSGSFAGSNNLSPPDASIPFANHGGIRDWQADRNQGLWIQDAHRRWYYAKLMGPCFGLNYAWSIGFDTRPMGRFDRFSSIIVPREGRCAVQSLTPSGPPPTKAELKARASD
jgi:hypothetical protein